MNKRVSNPPPILSKEEFHRIAEEVKANNRRLASCDQHMFPIQARKFREKFQCFHCKGEMDAGRVISYCQGFEAAGGDPRRVWGEYQRGGKS